MILRPASDADAAGLCAVINPLIAAGGTTAHRRPFTPARMVAHYIAPPDGVCCTLAEDEAGTVLGFQSLVRADPAFGDGIPAGWGIIATFVRAGHGRGGIGSALFAVTREAARAAGLVAIDATIRRENAGGLAYYGRMGFVTWRETDDAVSRRLDLQPR
ncbi:acetyltransferase, GNAT family protein [Oceanicola granulosus HTCC2516]|uniref:Acetyltransferase, GNAT family protein n=1 Tax=Oceanicola granulosus (strain ATCC BAA-861 / DSM 15982 / KCTC 12143 / HTCC2516) TaxID=314256 RepID=Q2CJN0_OCEGH|nr:GNAT family N-acetyltransferase [Oceanicola granulosus]EAR53109.1 acetyltransferase, GNAT family protein [Oceanicola granulosus HTCC2516]